ncbi:ABC transporter permease [Egicoccus sp. AB-alg2]|uniref:ABC transporter permease n=1 Tax=Egicoccus sp. AB-alg2 TaxID=3242693 RepID=UPI00359D8C07
MSAPTEADAAPSLEEGDDAGASPHAPVTLGATSPAGRVLGYVWTPLLVGASWALLYWWLSQRELGSIEQRNLTWSNVRTAFVQHLDISLWATVFVLLIAIPLGVALTRPWARRVAPSIVTFASIGQGVPSLGTIILAFLIITRTGRNAAIIGLVAYCFLPVLRGTMVGLQQVSVDVVKAGRGMGMSRGQVLRLIELPLSVPVVLTGVRTSLVLTVSSAPLAAFIGAGTLGAFITSGFALTRPTLIYVGAVLAAGLALLADWLGGIIEDVLRPRGL